MNFLKNKIVWAFLTLAAILFCYSESDGRGDFYIFISAADDLTEDVDIFKKTYVDGYHYFYSVLFALVLKPFAALPFQGLKLSWLLLNVFLFASLFRLLIQSPLVNKLAERKRFIFLGCVLLFSVRFLKDNIHHSQITILILWCCVYGIYYITENKLVKGAFILALGINIKLLPIVLLPYLFYRGYFKACLLTLFFYTSLLFLPSVFIGHSYNVSLLKSWLQLINPTNQNHVLDVEERTFHGLSTLLSTLLVKDVPDVYALSNKRNIADVSLHTLSLVLLIVRMCLVSFTLYFTGIKFFKKAATAWHQSVELSYVLMIIPLIFPHQQPYAFLFVIPAVCCILYYLFTHHISKNKKKLVQALLVVVFLTFHLKLILGEFNNYYDHYKILTYGTLLLIPILTWVWKNSIWEDEIIF
ncbi:MAG: hypothetical protein JWO32_1398 [Bacteroidetes bacterium]|nr:hypothetical protein [Bacteroidota bacterium]